MGCGKMGFKADTKTCISPEGSEWPQEGFRGAA